MSRPLLAIVLVFLSAGAVFASLDRTQEFPHASHEGLFPVCEGCHRGIATGEREEWYPEPASCAECHDGNRLERVAWQPRESRASNLAFSHPEHDALVVDRGETVSCQACHATEAPAARMDVAGPRPEGCLECHAHQAEQHLAETAECQVCHVPITRAADVPIERIAAFPRPDSHDEPGFLSEHAPDGSLEEVSCSTCHARESCERCHANADRLDPVRSLERDERIASLQEGMSAEYPVPESHRSDEWFLAHGAEAAAAPAQCSNCHTQPGCTECHVESGARSSVAIAGLPSPVPGGASGVNLMHVADDMHAFDFRDQHATVAASGALECQECHSQQYCSDCHAGTESTTGSSDFHPANFMERHAVEVFSGASDCQSCHSTEAFCRDCHQQTGVASQGQLDVAFHTAQPLWVLSHGQAARIGLESCASCHRQTDCLACHSTFLGRNINPHGPGFDAEGMAARNRVTCRWCHLDDPLGGG